MNRADKLSALQKLLEGEPATKVFPFTSLLIVESFTDTHSRLIWEGRAKDLQPGELDDYLDKIRQANPLQLFSISRISKQRYDDVMDYLESEY